MTDLAGRPGSVEIDGYAAGPDQGVDHRLGRGGERLHPWMFEADRPGRESDAAVLADVVDGVGAYVMGRNMFGGEPGDLAWTGWWGEEPRITHRCSCSPTTSGHR